MRLPDGLRWNLLHLFTEAVGALRGRSLDGVGVDTWGVDYALLDERGRVLGLPFHYRDERTEGASGVAGYDVTGIQDMPINTVYQLLADDSPALRDGARDRARARPARVLAVAASWPTSARTPPPPGCWTRARASGRWS